MNLTRLEEFRPEHARTLWACLETEGCPPPLPIEEMVKAYRIPGSVSASLMLVREGGSMPIVSGGIINMQWRRGEAWVLASPLLAQYRISAYRAIKAKFYEWACGGKFRRIQAISYSPNNTLIEHLGFEKEAVLECFGPEGENGIVYKFFCGGE